MRKTLLLLVALVVLTLAPSAMALKVVATTPHLAALARELGGDRVTVSSLALHTQDPHWVDARPHLALALSKAELLLVNGAELEVGWLPTLQTGSRNGAVGVGGRGYLDASTLVSLLEVPSARVDRSMGDIHTSGNPHYLFDPRRMERVAIGIAKRMAELDPASKNAYLDNTKAFISRLRAAQASWGKQLATLRGRKVVSYHKSLVYLEDWLGFEAIAHIEPRPGIPPNPRHVADVIAAIRSEGVKLIVQEEWYPNKTAHLIADKTGAKLVALPGMPDFRSGQTYVDFMNEVVARLAKAL
jgi:zinc/manganese transport system substrate-binding protein